MELIGKDRNIKVSKLKVFKSISKSKKLTKNEKLRVYAQLRKILKNDMYFDDNSTLSLCFVWHEYEDEIDTNYGYDYWGDISTKISRFN